MKLNKWLDFEAGRTTKLAVYTGRTPSAVSQWRTNGVPVDLMRKVVDFTNGEVSLDDMVPDLAHLAPASATAGQGV